MKLGFVKTTGLNNRHFTKINSVTVTKTRSNKYFASVLVETGEIHKKRKSDLISGVDGCKGTPTFLIFFSFIIKYLRL